MIKSIPYYFTKPFSQGKKVAFFRRVLYIFLLINTITLFPSVTDIFGYNGIAGTRGFSWNGLGAFFNLLSHPINVKHEWIAWFFVIGQMISIIFSLLRIWPVLASIGVYFFTINLFTKAGLFITGGEVLINILLFYLIFIRENKQGSYFQNIINNTVYYIILIQICVLYFFSTYFKLIDENWVNGMALTYVSKIVFYSSDLFYEIVNSSEILARIMTWSVLAYQGLFFIMVWIKKVKIPFLIYGVIMHLAISFGMGIFSFGIIMIITYILFLDDHHIDRLRLKRNKING